MFKEFIIRYNKKSWLVSNYLARFFKMCGFMVYEVYEDEILDSDYAEDKYIIIDAKQHKIGKQLLQETIINNLSYIADINEFSFLIDTYVDFSVYDILCWIEYYCKHDKRKNVENGEENINQLYNVLDNLTNYEETYKYNLFFRFSILYLKYNINKFCKIKKYVYEYDNEELIEQCSNSIFMSHFYNSINVLIGLIYELEPINAPFTIRAYVRVLEKGSSKKTKEFAKYHIAKTYEKYKANQEDAIKLYQGLIEKQPDNVFILFDFVNFISSDSSMKNKFVEERISYLNHIIAILNEKEIPLSPKELILRIFALYLLMAIYFIIKEDYLEAFILGKNYLKKYYDAIGKSTYFDYFNFKENKIRITELIIENQVMKGAYSILAYSAKELGFKEFEEKYFEEASKYN